MWTVVLAVILSAGFSRSALAEIPTLEPGQLLTVVSLGQSGGLSVMRIDLTTGDRDVLSGPTGFGSVRGAGPSIQTFGNTDGPELVQSNDDFIYVSSASRYFKIDPVTGDRSIVSGCSNDFTAPCPGPVVGAGPEVKNSYGIAVVPDEGVSPEEFEALAAEVEDLIARIANLEDSDVIQADEISALNAMLDDVKSRLTVIEGLPGIANKLP